LGYHSDWVRTHLPTRREKNAFFSQIGKKYSPGLESQHALRQRVEQAGGAANLKPGDFLK
jgi:hypothetical protein